MCLFCPCVRRIDVDIVIPPFPHSSHTHVSPSSFFDRTLKPVVAVVFHAGSPLSIPTACFVRDLVFDAVRQEDWEELSLVLQLDHVEYMDGWDLQPALSHPTLSTVVVDNLESLWGRLREGHQRYSLLCAAAASHNPAALSTLAATVLSFLHDDCLCKTFERPPDFSLVGETYTSPFELACARGLESNVDELFRLFDGRPREVLNAAMLPGTVAPDNHTIFHALAASTKSTGNLEFVAQTVKRVLENLLATPSPGYAAVEAMLSSDLIPGSKFRIRRGPAFYAKRPGQLAAFLNGIRRARILPENEDKGAPSIQSLLVSCVRVPVPGSEFGSPCFLLLHAMRSGSDEDFISAAACLENESTESLHQTLRFACATRHQTLIRRLLWDSPLSRHFEPLTKKPLKSDGLTIVVHACREGRLAPVAALLPCHREWTPALLSRDGRGHSALWYALFGHLDDDESPGWRPADLGASSPVPLAANAGTVAGAGAGGNSSPDTSCDLDESVNHPVLTEADLRMIKERCAVVHHLLRFDNFRRLVRRTSSSSLIALTDKRGRSALSWVVSFFLGLCPSFDQVASAAVSSVESTVLDVLAIALEEVISLPVDTALGLILPALRSACLTGWLCAVLALCVALLKVDRRSPVVDSAIKYALNSLTCRGSTVHDAALRSSDGRIVDLRKRLFGYFGRSSEPMHNGRASGV